MTIAHDYATDYVCATCGRDLDAGPMVSRDDGRTYVHLKHLPKLGDRRSYRTGETEMTHERAGSSQAAFTGVFYRSCSCGQEFKGSAEQTFSDREDHILYMTTSPRVTPRTGVTK